MSKGSEKELGLALEWESVTEVEERWKVSESEKALMEKGMVRKAKHKESEER